MPSTKQRTLTWSKEVERRVRDEYKRRWSGAARTKQLLRREVKGASDLVGTPFHVQVKARASTWIGSQFRDATKHAGGLTVHLVTQDKQGEPLVTMRLRDYIDDISGDVHLRRVRVSDDGPGEDQGEAVLEEGLGSW